MSCPTNASAASSKAVLRSPRRNATRASTRSGSRPPRLRPRRARAPPGGPPPPTPAARGSAAREGLLPPSRSCLRARRRPGRPATCRSPSVGPTALPARTGTLTRLRFRIGGRTEQGAGAGGPNEDDWLSCLSLWWMRQSLGTRRRCGGSRRVPPEVLLLFFSGLLFNSLRFLFRRRWRRHGLSGCRGSLGWLCTGGGLAAREPFS